MDGLDQFNLWLLLLDRRDDGFQFNGVYVGGRGSGWDWDQVEGVWLQFQRIQIQPPTTAYLADVGEGTMFGLLMNVVDRLGVLLLVVNEAAAVGPCPGALVTLVWVFTSVSASVIDQVVRTFELFTTKITCVAKFCFVNQLVFL